MPCDDGRDDIRFRVALGKNARQPLFPKGVPPPTDEEQVNAPRQKAEAYLKQHNLEVRLAEVLQLLLRDRPDNPTEYVYERLQKNENMISQLPNLQLLNNLACKSPSKGLADLRVT